MDGSKRHRGRGWKAAVGMMGTRLFRDAALGQQLCPAVLHVTVEATYMARCLRAAALFEIFVGSNIHIILTWFSTIPAGSLR